MLQLTNVSRTNDDNNNDDEEEEEAGGDGQEGEEAGRRGSRDQEDGELGAGVTLKGLKPQTEYIILVQAYNSLGAGPQSDGLLIKTTEDGKEQEETEGREGGEERIADQNNQSLRHTCCNIYFRLPFPSSRSS